MVKKIATMALLLLTTVGARAQFEEGKKYVNASLTSLDLSYNGLDKGRFGLQAAGGYLFTDDWLAEGHVGYEKRHDVPATLNIGVGVRYYIVQNGLYVGVTGDYVHTPEVNDDFMPGVHLGYAFFLNGSVTVEPEVYYKQSFKNHGDYSTVGFRVGIGFYL